MERYKKDKTGTCKRAGCVTGTRASVIFSSDPDCDPNKYVVTQKGCEQYLRNNVGGNAGSEIAVVGY